MIKRWFIFAAAAMLLHGSLVVPALAAKDIPIEKCRSGKIDAGDGTKDLWVVGPCLVPAGTYKWQDINIIAGGSLTVADEKVDLWTTSILIENGGKLIAGSSTAPIGKNGGRFTVHLYGRNQGDNGQGITCVSDAYCGVPKTTWDSDGSTPVPLPGVPDDYFYQYGPLSYDGGGNTPGFFGYKVLGVGYGGTLQLFGYKGATYGDLDSSQSGTSWTRLATTLLPGKQQITVEGAMNTWQPGDEIVVTTTDYLPGHSEQFTLNAVTVNGDGTTTLTINEVPLYRHQGEAYALPDDVGRLKLNMTRVETRAAVALLTRSIRVVSEGDNLGDPFPPPTVQFPVAGANPPRTEGYYFGGHTVVRQGVASYQVQGVEFKQLGQGGRIGHYPVHFHRVRQVPPDTFVKDSSVNESMTRWYVIHATSGVTLARNVGWQSIGHGFYIEEGAETDNRFLTNLGIFARAAIDNPQNPRKVPGILAATMNPAHAENVPFYSDYDHPTIFWIMNGWNDFEYNMAAGAGSCGVCYWFLPGAVSGHSRHQKWSGYASLQQNTTDPSRPLDRASLTPLRTFVGNSCTSAMTSFNTIGNTTACYGVAVGQTIINAVPNPLAPPSCNQVDPTAADGCAQPANVIADDYYPKVDPGGGRFATICNGGDCSNVPKCGDGFLQNCMITAIDRFTTSFNWPETNFAAVWLRPQWYLLSNSAITDVQNGGLTFVTGGGYTASDVVPGHWALVRKSVFIGNTQAPVTAAGEKDFASNAGPFNPKGLACAGNSGQYCLSAAEGVSFPNSNFGMNTRMFNIYDGPAYQESNAYFDITKRPITDCTLAAPGAPNQVCGSSQFLAGRVLGLPWDPVKKECFMPNAAIGWKQPNGFYYPPAFHSNNLYFRNVDIRHYVIEPLFAPGTYKTDVAAARGAYCNFNDALFTGFTDVDRQTELSDDDGSLTGYVNTISVNLDPFFNAPVEAVECASENTAKTSPYDYVTSVVYPHCATTGNKCSSNWAIECSNQFCYGVPLYRQLLVSGERDQLPIKMAGQSASQRSSLTANNGSYYIDTTVGAARQQAAGASFLNVFEANSVYYSFLLFAKPQTKQTYSLYVGTGFDSNVDVWASRADVSVKPPVFGGPGAQPWPSGWTRDYDPVTGVLTVTMDMSFPEFATNYNAAYEGRCQPASFCSWDGAAKSCGCNPASRQLGLCQDPSNNGKDVCSWAMADVDCPKGGCYGIGFKMSSQFVTDKTSPRPAAACFNKAKNPGFDVVFKSPADPTLAGSCEKSPTLPSQFCN